MSNKNLEFLKDLNGKTFFFDELASKGFRDDSIVKTNTAVNDPLLGRIIFHNKTYYQGFTLELVNNDKFTVVSNNLSKNEADKLNLIRNMECDIESLNNSIHAYRFEFEDIDYANKLEKKKEELVQKLNQLKQ